MNLQIKHLSTECPPDVRDAIEDKMSRFEHLLPETAYTEVIIRQLAKVQGDGDKEAEVLVDIPGVKPVIRFVAHGTTFLEALDRVLDRLDEDLGQRKNRWGDHSYDGPSPKEWLAEEVRQVE